MQRVKLLACVSLVVAFWSAPDRAGACEVQHRSIINTNVFMTNSMTDPCSFVFFGLSTVATATAPDHRITRSNADYKIPFANGDIYAPLWYIHNE